MGHWQAAEAVHRRGRAHHRLDSRCWLRHRRKRLVLRKPRLQVTGIDYLEEPIRRARLKAIERGLSATFLVKDAMTLKDWSERFDNVIDSGLFHVFSDDDRKKYVESLATVLKPGGRVFLASFSDEEPGTQGPRRISKKELHDAFAKGWIIEWFSPSGSRPGLTSRT